MNDLFLYIGYKIYNPEGVVCSKSLIKIGNIYQGFKIGISSVSFVFFYLFTIKLRTSLYGLGETYALKLLFSLNFS